MVSLAASVGVLFEPVAVAVLALLLGVAVGNVLRGVPVTAEGEWAGSFLGLLNPYAVLVGLVSLSFFTLHGALYLRMKATGALLYAVYFCGIPLAHAVYEKSRDAAKGDGEWVSTVNDRIDRVPIRPRRSGRGVIHADRIAAGGDSVLAEIDSLEFEAGLKALCVHAAHVDPRPVTEPIDFFAFASSAPSVSPAGRSS